jgi:hypothetical protein
MAHDKCNWPDWANYIAMDKNGDWWFYELEPECESGEWIDYNMGKMLHADAERYELFRNSLTPRPQE